MEKENIIKVLYAISISLIIVFLIILAIDYSKYDTYTNSAPFSTFIIIRTLEFIVPSIILFLIARRLK